jgi:hypothetical protein
MKTMLNKVIGALSIAALVGFALAAPASAHGGGSGGGGFSGMHGGGFPGGMGMPGAGSSGGVAMRGSPQGSFGHGDGEHSWGHDHDHDGDHDHHHHHDHDGDFYFLDDPYFDYGDAYYGVASEDDGYWYYCSDSATYFPYVKVCASGWERVQPTP